jgi:CRISPR-associated endonuclease Csn1
MSSKVVGLDLGTNSLGLSLRNPDNGKNIIDQIELFSVNTFKAGVGRNDKGAEVSYAAQRTEKRSARRLYQSRKYRKWATLQLLIKHGFCPMTEDELNRWRYYDQSKVYIRK